MGRDLIGDIRRITWAAQLGPLLWLILDRDGIVSFPDVPGQRIDPSGV